MATALSVNLNAIASLRNRRDMPWPDILHFAEIALTAGAKGITIHPRPDQRHIRFKDVEIISSFLKENFKDAELNIEGYPSEEFLDLSLPYAHQITLVPDSPEQKTSDHGWDFQENQVFLSLVLKPIKARGIRASAFINPSSKGLEIAKSLGFDSVELYTGPYALSHFYQKNYVCELKKLKDAAFAAKNLDFGVHAGHDLTSSNLSFLIREIPFLREVSIGHALTVEALEHGMFDTVKRFLKIIS